MIGRTISCVDPGGPPKDTHVLLSSLVWRCCPLPHVAHEVIESVVILRGESIHWGDSMEAILSLVTLGELSLPQVGAVWLELVSPWVNLTCQDTRRQWGRR